MLVRRPIYSTIPLICLLMMYVNRQSHSQVETPSDKERATIATLIDRLPQLTEGDIGYSATRSGSGFLPLGKSSTGTMLLGVKPPSRSETMREIVSLGAVALPKLIAHLNDQRPTKIKLSHDFI